MKVGPPEVAGTGKRGNYEMWMLKILAAYAALVVSAAAYAAEPMPPFGDLPDSTPIPKDLGNGFRCLETHIPGSRASMLELIHGESTVASAVFVDGVMVSSFNEEQLSRCPRPS